MSATETDQAERAAHGRPLRSPYLDIIGDSPTAGPDDRDTARAYLQKVQAALDDDTLSLTHAERHRLIEKRSLWRKRAEGLDARYRVVGTRPGRLERELELKIDEERKRLRLRTGFAQGGPDLDGELDDTEAGEMAAPKLSDGTYIIPAQDNKGHSQRIYCRVMPYHFRAIVALMRDRRFPFRTQGDLIRWCVVRGLTELNAMAKSGEVESLMLQAEAIKEILLAEQYAQEFQDIFASARNVVRMHLGADAKGEAQRVVAMVKRQVDQMPDGYWKARYLETVNKEFGYLLDSAQVQGASLVSE